MPSIRFHSGAKPLCAILLVLAAALLLAACGSSSSTTSTSSATATASAVAQNTGVRSRVRLTARTRPDPVTSGVVTHRPLHGTGGGEINDDNPGNADAPAHASSSTDVRPAGAALNPCTLVSSAQARAILGTPVETPTEAPLGPTCIYREDGSHSFVTVAVEAVDLAKINAHLRNRTQLAVAGRTAYCGTYGQPTVFVPLASGRVLAVTASCAIGAKFAATALPRLGA